MVNACRSAEVSRAQTAEAKVDTLQQQLDAAAADLGARTSKVGPRNYVLFFLRSESQAISYEKPEENIRFKKTF